MSLVKSGARLALHSLGGLSLIRSYHQSQFRILMYHRFSAPSPDLSGAFHAQLSAFRRSYSIIPMAEVAEWLERGRTFPRRVMVLTIDDGHRDFFTTAFPVLRDLGLPATQYLVTGFLDRELWLWPDQLVWVFKQTEQDRVCLKLDGRSEEFMLSSATQREAALRRVLSIAKSAPNRARQQLVADVVSALQVTLPEQPPAYYEAATWDEIREMARNGIEFGSHTHTHPILSRIEDPQEMRWELERSKQRLEEELGTPAMHFCYPNGRPEDYTDATVDQLKSLGYRTAVTTTPSLNSGNAEVFHLCRFGMEPISPLQYSLERVEGLHDRP